MQDLRIVWRNLVPEPLVVLTYDKPGVGESSGQFHEVRTDTSEQQLRSLADDVLACVEFLKKYPMVDPKKVGLFGGSQAGWIIPIASDVQKGHSLQCDPVWSCDFIRNGDVFQFTYW